MRQLVWLAGIALLLPGTLFAQGDDGVLAGEKVGPQARYEAVRRMLQAPPAPEDVCALTALLPAGSLHAFSCLALPKAVVYEKAFEEYRGMLLDSPDALVKLAADEPTTTARVSLSVRRLVAQQILRLPPSLQDQHRRHDEAEARKLLTDGRQRRAADPLQRLVREYPLSTSASEAHDLLGDLAFEAGDFAMALYWWQRLAPLPSEVGETNSLSTAETARIQAKQILALAFQGTVLDARGEFEAFRRRHPQTTGTLAGKSGRFIDILGEWLAVRAEHVDETREEPWSTFGGDTSRQRALPTSLPAALWMDGPTWRVPIPRHDKDGPHPAERFLLQRHAPYHPIVAEGQVLIADARSVTSYDLDSGKLLFQHRLVLGAKEELPDKMPFGQRPRYTLSAAAGRVFARLGRMSLGPRDPGDAPEAEAPVLPSVLVCLDIASRPLPPGGQLLWQVDAKTPEGEPAFFEGAPLVGDNRVWMLVSDLKGTTTRTSLACFDFQGKLRWLRELYEGVEFLEGRGDRARHHVLSRSGPNLIAVSHSGAIVAVDAESGTPQWGVRYPRLGTERDAIPRELLPALAHQGRVLVAPADSHVVLGLDAVTGRVLWEREHLHATQLLGAGQGSVLIALPSGLAALDLDSGRTRWQQPSLGKLPSLGRGLIAGPWYLWPTHDSQLPFRAIHVADGTPFQNADGGYEPTQLRHLPAGNVVFGQGSLVIATPNKLAAYVGPRRRLANLQAKAAAADARPADGYRLALAQAMLGIKETTPAPEGDWQKLLTSRLAAPIAPMSCIQRTIPSRRPDSERAAPILPETEPRLLWKQSGWLVPVVSSGGGPDAAFGMSNGMLDCFDLRTGAKRWQAFPRHTPVTWLGHRDDVILAAGPRGIDAFSLADGERRWSHAASESVRYRFDPSGPVLEAPLTAFSDFAWQQGYLSFFQDWRRAIVVSAETGEVLHCVACKDADVRPIDGERFLPIVELVPRDGDMRVRLNESVESDALLSYLDVSPTNRLCAKDPGQVSFVGRDEMRPRWTFSYPAKSLLVGRMPQMLGKDDMLLASFQTSLGPALFRLDAATGRAIWRFDPGTTPDLDSAALDSTAFYMLKQSKLAAFSLSNGRLLWTQPLPEHIPEWLLKAMPGGILVSPKAPPFRPWIPLSLDFTSPWSLYGSVKSPREFPVLFVDRASGKILWDLRFDARGGSGHVQLQRDVLLVSTGGRIYALGAEIGNKP